MWYKAAGDDDTQPGRAEPKQRSGPVRVELGSNKRIHEDKTWCHGQIRCCLVTEADVLMSPASPH